MSQTTLKGVRAWCPGVMGGNEKRGWRIRQRPHRPLSHSREFDLHPDVGHDSIEGLEQGSERVKFHFQTLTLATV